MEASEFNQTVASVHTQARERGLFFQQLADDTLRGRSIHLDGRELVSFASCSYLGLEHHPALVAGVHDAVERYGTQFSASRGYLSAPGYDELEDTLGRLFGGHVLVTPSTTAAHGIAIPVLASEKDGIVLDHQAHHSMHSAVTLARANGARIEVVRHGELDSAVDAVKNLSRSCETVWFVGDGVYSMFGDLAPVHLLQHLLSLAPNVRLYIDDAHGMSWAGRHGRGSFLSRMALSERIVLATSLNKAFSAGGGCLVFASEAERERVRICGGPMVFSGPLQPPMLGAALASARLHLSDEIVERQQRLAQHVAFANRAVRDAGLLLLCDSDSPILFVGLGRPDVVFEVAQRMRDDGCYVCASAYPSVPMKLGGIRLTLTAAHTRAQIEGVVERLAEHVPRVLQSHGVDGAELAERFEHALPRESRRVPVDVLLGGVASRPRPVPRLVKNVGLRVDVHASIDAIDPAHWDPLMQARGLSDHATLRSLESVFVDEAQPQNDWRFRYVVIRDGDRPVLATYWTTALVKDDMLMRREVSERVELRRVDEPLFLTSRAVMMGSLLSEGRHLFLDRGGRWREALRAALELAESDYEASQSSLMVLRDLPDDDPELDAMLLHEGLLKVPMLDSHRVDLDVDHFAYLERLGRRKRMHYRRNEAREAWYDVRVHGPGDRLAPDELSHLYRLYENVAERGLRLNVFKLPPRVLPALLEGRAWELVTLRLRPEHGGPEDGRPVAFFAAHCADATYSGFLCGVDYRFVTEHGAYRQVLHQALLRARARNAARLRLGMGADVEKHRLGSRREGNCAYVQARDDFGGVVLREIAAEAAWATG